MQKKCIPCEGGTPPLSQKETKELQGQLSSSWVVVELKRLERTVTCKSFKHAVALINAIAIIAEEENHHPDINLHEYKLLTFTLSTHAIKGLSENDFIVAAKIDALIAKSVYV